MTINEVKDFTETIKGYYPEFILEDFMFKIWYEALKDYDKEDVYTRLTKHLNGEYQNKVPKLNYLTKGLLTPEQKQKSNNIKVRCIYCNYNFPLEQISSHIARHTAIEYIKSREHYIDKIYNECKMMNATDDSFNKFYDSFLTELYCKLPNGKEKTRIEKLVFWSKTQKNN